MMLTGFLVLCGQGTRVQILIGLGVTLVSLQVYINVRPYIERSNNVLSEQAQWATLVVLVFALLLRVDDNDEEDFDRQLFGILLSVIALSIPLMVLYYAVRAFKATW